jgi:hypothetical protein
MAMAAMKMVSAGGFRGCSIKWQNVRRGSRVQFLRKVLFLGSDFQS